MKKWLDKYNNGGGPVKKLKPSEIADIKKFIANNADTEDINDPRYYTGKPVVNKAYNVTNRLSAGNLPRYVDPNVKNDPALKWVNAASMLGPIGVIAAPEIAAGVAALSPYLSAPLVVGGTELAAVTPASVAGAYFAHEGYKKLPQTQASVLNAYNNPTRQNILNAANDVGWNTMDFLGTGEAIRGATQLAEPIINKAGKTVVDKLSRLPFNNVPLLNQASKFNPWAFKTKPSVQELIPDVTYGTDELGSFRRVGNRKEYILSDYSESSMYEPTLTEPAYNSYMDLLNSHNGMIPSKKEEAFFRGLSVNGNDVNRDWDLIHSLNNNENYGQYLSRGRFTHQRYNAPSSFEELYNAQPSKPQKVIKKYLNDLDKKFGSFIPVKKAASYNSQELEDLINEKLRNGMGIKKINDPVQVKLLNHGNNLNRLDFQTIINNQHTGNIGLNRNVDPYIPGRMSFTDRIFPNRNGVNAWVNSEGFRKAGDFPFNSTTRASELYHSGMSGEINSAINEALKEKGLGNILSGGTGHTDMGKGRWQNLVNKGVAEDFGFDPRTNQNYYKLKKEGGESNGWLDRYDNGGQAPARDNTTVYRNVLPISMPQPKPAYINPTPSYKDSEWYKQESEDFKTKRNITQPVLHAADVVTDIMQFGNFIPLPQAQAIARTGNILGSLVDAYQAADAIANKDYVSGAMNATAALLPLYMRRNEFARDMYNTKPGSLADKIASYGNRDGSYLPLSGVRTNLIKNPVMRKAVDNNKKTFGALLTETGYDSYAKGGETYTIQPGDNLSSVAQKYGVSLRRLVDANNISNPDFIRANQTLVIPNVLNQKPESVYQDWESIKNKQNKINAFTGNDAYSPDEQIITQYYKNRPDDTYLVVDKKRARMNLYKGNQLQKTYEVGTGVNPGDAQTVTRVKDINNDGIINSNDKVNNHYVTDWQGGNKSTGAGVYTISRIDPKSKEYYDLPSFNLLNDQGVEVATSIHGTPVGRRIKFNDNNVFNNRMSNGCINGKCYDLEDIYKKVDVGNNVYILPEDEGNRFQLVDGKPILRVDSKNRSKYNTYVDELGNVRKGQGVNQSVNTLNYKPIKGLFDKKNFINNVYQWNDMNDENEYQSTTKPFYTALVNNKQRIMKEAKIPSDVYNEIAKMSFGIYGTESNFGDTHSAAGNLLRATKKVITPSSSSSPDYKSKYTTYGANEDTRSVGLTQLRWSYLSDDEKRVLKNLGITSNADFLNPEKAAIGTTAILGMRYNQQLTSEQKKDIWKNLPGKWNKRGNYGDRVKSNSRYLSFQQLDEKKDGGQIHNWREVEVPHTKNQLSGWLDKL